METRAHYTIVGSFVLFCIVALFVFVYWIQNVGGFGKQAIYRIQFNQPAAGLTRGGAVLFNGVRVGSILDLKLNEDQPRQLTATISVDPKTPVRTDTVADVTSLGFTGAPAIMLKGGDDNAARLQGKDGQPPTITAIPGAGTTLSDAARDTLGRLGDFSQIPR